MHFARQSRPRASAPAAPAPATSSRCSSNRARTARRSHARSPAKLVVYVRARKDGPGFWTAEQPRFLVAPYMETAPGSGWYRALKFQYTLPMETELAQSVIDVMRRRRAAVEMTAAEGQLRLEQRVLVEGGVTEEHLRLQLRNWRGFVAAVTAVARRLEADAED